MKNKTVLTSNIRKFLLAMQALSERGVGGEGMGLLWGEPGEGKSTTIAYVVNSRGGVFLRARVTWTVTSMLQALMRELDLEPSHRRDPMIERAIEELMRHGRPIIVDEADYLFRQTDMLDALRDIYDSAGVPVVLVGMGDIARRIRTNERFSRFRRRITQWVEFAGLTMEDARRVADELCEVHVSDDLLARLHEETRGNIGRVVIGLERIERLGRSSRLDTVGLAEFGARRLCA